MATLESLRLDGDSSFSSLTGGASEYTRGMENKAEL